MSKLELSHHEEKKLLRIKVVVSIFRKHTDIFVVWGCQLRKTKLVVDLKALFLLE
jgi:hypothetical protein